MSSSPMMDRRPPFAVPTGDFQFCAARATASHSPKERLAADADARTPKDVSLNKGVTCDAIGCIGKLTDGRLASMVLEIEAFAEDCARAAVVVSAREAPSSACAETLVDRDVWRAHGRGAALDGPALRTNRCDSVGLPTALDARRGERCIDRAGRERARDT
jgi:hypothetical protein